MDINMRYCDRELTQVVTRYSLQSFSIVLTRMLTERFKADLLSYLLLIWSSCQWMGQLWFGRRWLCLKEITNVLLWSIWEIVLYVIHGTSCKPTGEARSGWNLSIFFRAFYCLFKGSLAWYTQFTEMNKNYLEKKVQSSWKSSMWLIVFRKWWLCLEEQKSDVAPFRTVETLILNPLIETKPHFLLFFCSVLQPFLFAISVTRTFYRWSL